MAINLWNSSDHLWHSYLPECEMSFEEVVNKESKFFKNQWQYWLYNIQKYYMIFCYIRIPELLFFSIWQYHYQ